MIQLVEWLNAERSFGITLEKADQSGLVGIVIPSRYSKCQALVEFANKYLFRDSYDVGPVEFFGKDDLCSWNIDKTWPPTVCTHFGLMIIGRCGDGASVMLDLDSGWICHHECGAIQGSGIEWPNKLPVGKVLPFSNESFLVSASKSWESLPSFFDWLLMKWKCGDSFDPL